LRAARYVHNLDEQTRVIDVDRRHMAIDHAFDGVNFRWSEAHLVREMIPRHRDAGQDLAHLRFVVDESKKGLAARARPADAEHVFSSGIQVENEQVVIEQNDARAQAVEDASGVVLKRSIPGTASVQRTVLCCT
jgi:hypothetical protein